MQPSNDAAAGENGSAGARHPTGQAAYNAMGYRNQAARETQRTSPQELNSSDKKKGGANVDKQFDSTQARQPDNNGARSSVDAMKNP